MAPEDINWPETLRITVESTDEAFDRIRETTDFDSVADEAVRSFATPTRAFELITDGRIGIIRSLMDEPADSISALADRLDRSDSAVHDDVEMLAEYGIIQFRSDTHERAPFVPYETVEIDVTITGTRTEDSEAST